MKKQDTNVKGHGFFRKTSVGLASGIVLGATLLLGAGVVSADETSSTPSDKVVASATASEGEVVVDNGLTKVAEEAQKSGLQVEKEPTKNIGTAETQDKENELKKTAEADVEAQKKTIKTAQDKFVEENKKVDENLSNLKKLFSENRIYRSINSNLAYAQDYDYSKGNVKFGEITSSKGKVDFVNVPSDKFEIDLSSGGLSDSLKKLSLGSTDKLKEVTYSVKKDDGSYLSILDKNSVISDKNNAKGIPVYLSPNETISYRVEFGDDSSLASLGIKYKDVKLSLKGTGVNDSNSHSIGFLSPYGSSLLSGGVIHFWDNKNQLNRNPFVVESSYNYLDKDGKVLDKKVLGKNWFNKGIAKGSNIDETFFSDGVYKEVKDQGDNEVYSSDKYSAEIGGTDFHKVTRQGVPNGRDFGAFFQDVYNASKPASVNPKSYTKEQSEKVAYHLVSYNVSKSPVNNVVNNVKKGSIVQRFVDENGKEISPKTNTGEKPVDEVVKLDHPKEITFGGKTYVFTKQDKVDPSKIPDGQETITYVYKLKEDTKPIPVPTTTPAEKPIPAPVDGKTSKEVPLTSETPVEQPQVEKSSLPYTGTAESSLGILGVAGVMSTILGVAGLKRKKD